MVVCVYNNLLMEGTHNKNKSTTSGHFQTLLLKYLRISGKLAYWNHLRDKRNKTLAAIVFCLFVCFYSESINT